MGSFIFGAIMGSAAIQKLRVLLLVFFFCPDYVLTFGNVEQYVLAFFSLGGSRGRLMVSAPLSSVLR